MNEKLPFLTNQQSTNNRVRPFPPQKPRERETAVAPPINSQQTMEYGRSPHKNHANEKRPFPTNQQSTKNKVRPFPANQQSTKNRVRPFPHKNWADEGTAVPSPTNFAKGGTIIHSIWVRAVPFPIDSPGAVADVITAP
jgi:hypothetical protein